MPTQIKRMALCLLALAASALAAPGAHGPNGEHLDAPPATTGNALARLPDGSVNVPKLAQRRMAIRTVMAQAGEHPLTVELNGRAAMDPNFGGRVQAPHAGRIEPGPNGLPLPGQAVRKGQVLARLVPLASAVDRANQAAQLAELRAGRGLLERRVRRLESLDGTVPAKDLDAARAELAASIGREQALVSAVGRSQAITAPASGVLAGASVMNGQIVESRDILFEIVDPARMLIEAATADPGLAGRIAGASLEQAPALTLTPLGGARVLRDGALALLFRASAGASGKDMGLALGQPVTVIARLRTPVKGIALPAAALARNSANETVVWVKSGAQRFIALPVETRPLDARTVVVTRGLAPDKRVVVSGTALISQIR